MRLLLSHNYMVWYKNLRKEEKEMENKKIVVKGTEMEVVDGKVVISSEELAAAIQTQQIDLGAEEEANIDISIRGVHCK